MEINEMTVKELTYDELATLISRFSSSMRYLKNTGDYPENKRDQSLLRKLIDMQFIQFKKMHGGGDVVR